jgi:hypothetical protein
VAGQDGIRVAKAYMEITTNVDPAMAELASKVRAAGQGVEQDSKRIGTNVDKGISDGIKKSTTTERAMGDKGKKAGQEFDKGAGDEIRKGRQTDDAVSSVARRSQAKFQALQFAGMFAGLPAAAAIAAAGVGVALGGVPLIFAGIALAALGQNQIVEASFDKLTETVRVDTKKLAEPMAGPLAQGADLLRESFIRLEPAIQGAFLNSGPALLAFTGGITQLAENMMPGFTAAIKSSEAPMKGLESLLASTGSGLGDFFTNLTKGAAGAQVGLQITGGILRDFLGFAGTLFANLANGSAGILPQFAGALGQVEGVLTTLTSKGMPALQGLTTGFLGTIGGGLGILQAGASALGSWAAPLGQMGGSLLATNTVAKLFGTSLTETGFGLKAFSTTVDEAGKKTSPFSTAVSNATGVTGKLSAGVKSIVSGGFNPMGIALLGVGALLDHYGEQQQRAAEYVAAHKQNVQNLTQALREDNGTLGVHTDAVNQQALAEKNAANNLSIMGANLGIASAAINGNSQAYEILGTKSTDALTAIGKAGGLSAETTSKLAAMGKTALDTGQNYDQLKGSIEPLMRESKLLTVAGGEQISVNKDLSASQKAAVEAIINGNGAVGEQVKAEQAAQTAYRQAESALTGLTEQQVANRDATVKDTIAIFAQQDASLGYRDSVQKTDDALDKYNKALKGGDEDAKAKALLALEKAFSTQEQAAYKSALANSKASTEAGKEADAAKALNTETVRLADTYKGVLPQSISETIGKFDLATAAGAGLKVSVNKAGQAVYDLPSGKEIVITGDTKSIQDTLKALPTEIAKTGPGVLAIEANTDKATGKTRAAVQFADGSIGVITVDANKDPATGKTLIAVQYANGQRSFMTIDGFNEAAKEKTLQAVRNADGSTGWIVVEANTGPAMDAVHNMVRTLSGTVIRLTTTASGTSSGGLIKAQAQGGLLKGFAQGGFTGMTPMSGSMAEFVPKNTQRVIGDNMEVPELFAPLDGSERTRRLLMEAAGHEGLLAGNVKAFANGGLLGLADEVLQQFQAGHTVYEDLAYPGYSDAGRGASDNDSLADAYYANNTGQGMRQWLSDYIANGQPVASSVGGQTVATSAGSGTSEVSTAVMPVLAAASQVMSDARELVQSTTTGNGTKIENHYHITSTDPELIIARVSSELAWQLRNK